MKTETKTNDITGVSEATLTYKIKVKPKDRAKIHSSKDPYQIYLILGIRIQLNI